MSAIMNFGALSRPGTALGGRARPDPSSPASPGTVRFTPQQPAPQRSVAATELVPNRSMVSHVNLSNPSDVSEMPDYDIFSHTASEVHRNAMTAGRGAPKATDDGFGGDPVGAFAAARSQAASETKPPPTFKSDAANNYYSAMRVKHAEGGSIGGSRASANKSKISIRQSAKDTMSKMGLKKKKSSKKKAPAASGIEKKYETHVAKALKVVKAPEEAAGYVMGLPDEQEVDKMDLFGAIVTALKKEQAKEGAQREEGDKKLTPVVTPAAAPSPVNLDLIYGAASQEEDASTTSSITAEGGNTVVTEKPTVAAKTDAKIVLMSDDPPIAAYPSPIDSPEEARPPAEKKDEAYAVLERVGLPEGLKLPTDEEAEEESEESGSANSSEKSGEYSSAEEDERIAEQSVEHSQMMFETIAQGDTKDRMAHATAAEATLQRQQELRRKSKKKRASPVSTAGKKLVRSLTPTVFVKGDEKSKVTKDSDDTTAESSLDPAASTGSGKDARECIASSSPKKAVDGDATPRTKGSKKPFNPAKAKALPPRIPSRASPGAVPRQASVSIHSSDDGSVECHSVNGDKPSDDLSVTVVHDLPADAADGAGKETKKKGRMAAAREMYRKKALPKSPTSPRSPESAEAEQKDAEKGANTDAVEGVPSLEEESVSTDAAARTRKKDRMRKVLDYRKRASPMPRKKVSQKTLDGWLVGTKSKDSQDRGSLLSYSRSETDTREPSVPTSADTGLNKEDVRPEGHRAPRQNRPDERLSLVPGVSRDASLDERAPLKQIKFDPHRDDITQADLSLPPELVNAKKTAIWSEKESVSFDVGQDDQDENSYFYYCGGGGGTEDGVPYDGDDSILDKTESQNASRERPRKARMKKKSGRGLSIEDVKYEISESVQDISWGVKQGIRWGVGSCFGACDITNEGGVDILEANLSKTGDQLAGRAPYQHPTSPVTKKEKESAEKESVDWNAKANAKKATPQDANLQNATPKQVDSQNVNRHTAKPTNVGPKNAVNPLAQKLSSMLRRDDEMQREEELSTVIRGGIETTHQGGPQTLEKAPEKKLTVAEKRSLYLEKLKSLSMKHL